MSSSAASARPGTACRSHASRVDYFSFFGRDARGTVGFAIDNARGRSCDEWNARHFVAFQDEHRGWLRVDGDGGYVNATKDIKRIPPSTHFKFDGDRRTGITMVSPSNGLKLVSRAYPASLVRRDGDELYTMSVAPAQFEWSGRRITGRMIHEEIISSRRNLDRLDTATVWRNYNGFYLLTDTGHDFYFHRYDGEPLRALYGREVGIASWDGAAPIASLRFEITEAKPSGTGRFDWPMAWRCEFKYRTRRYRLSLKTKSWNYIYDWQSGGFAMSIVEGVAVADDGSHIGMTGFGEFLI
jgi:hypothetical protein